MEIKKCRERLILTEEEAKILIKARDLLENVYENAYGDDLETYSEVAANELNNFLADMDIEVEIKQKEPAKEVAVISLDEFEF